MMDTSGKESLAVEGLPARLLQWWRTRNGRVAGERSRRELQVVEMLSLGSRRQLVRVRCGEREFLVGLGAEQVTCIEPLGLRPDRATQGSDVRLP